MLLSEAIQDFWKKNRFRITEMIETCEEKDGQMSYEFIFKLKAKEG